MLRAILHGRFGDGEWSFSIEATMHLRAVLKKVILWFVRLREELPFGGFFWPHVKVEDTTLFVFVVFSNKLLYRCILTCITPVLFPEPCLLVEVTEVLFFSVLTHSFSSVICKNVFSLLLTYFKQKKRQNSFLVSLRGNKMQTDQCKTIMQYKTQVIT